MAVWNPWHGCTKISDGCLNCYVYRTDAKYGRNSNIIVKNKNFNLPIQKNKKGDYLIKDNTILYTCFSSDFFHENADELRIDAWNIIKERSKVKFLIITKRIDRFTVNLPVDWNEGYDNVIICSTCETQDRADYRLSIFETLPIKHKMIICEPLLEKIDLRKYLRSGKFSRIVTGGESGNEARVCNYDWIIDLRMQCLENNVEFWFKQTGARFIKDGKQYRIKRKFQHSQARKANINIMETIEKRF